MQTLPAVFLALYVRWLDRWAVIAGWIVGIAYGTYMLIKANFGNQYAPGGLKTTFYIALIALVANLVVVVVGSLLARAFGWQAGRPRITDASYQEATA